MAVLTGMSFPNRLRGEQEAVLFNDGVMETIYLPVHCDEIDNVK